MKISEMKSIVNSTAVELTLSIILLAIAVPLNHMLVAIFPNTSRIIYLIVAVFMLAIFYSFVRSSIANVVKTSKLFDTIKKLIK